MSNFEELEKDHLEIEGDDEPRQIWIRVRDAEKLILKENPKMHDLGSLISSISRYGFQEVAKYDGTVKGIKAGNGRIEALAVMERDGREVPRGIATEKETGAWVMPLSVGVDAVSRSEAFAYLTDSNNLVLAGGDLDGFDMARLWDAHYVDLLQGLDALPVSVDAEMLGALSSVAAIEDFARPDFDDLIEEFEEPETGQTHKDEKWFYVEFYRDQDRWDEMCELLKPYLKGASIHELDADFFYQAVKNAAIDQQ